MTWALPQTIPPTFPLLYFYFISDRSPSNPLKSTDLGLQQSSTTCSNIRVLDLHVCSNPTIKDAHLTSTLPLLYLYFFLHPQWCTHVLPCKALRRRVQQEHLGRIARFITRRCAREWARLSSLEIRACCHECCRNPGNVVHTWTLKWCWGAWYCCCKREIMSISSSK